jgi:hypothetical protein
MLGTTFSNEYTEITVCFLIPKMFATDNKLSDILTLKSGIMQLEIF